MSHESPDWSRLPGEALAGIAAALVRGGRFDAVANARATCRGWTKDVAPLQGSVEAISMTRLNSPASLWAGLRKLEGVAEGVRSLDMSQCDLLQDEEMWGTRLLPGLTSLDLGRCSRITDRGLLAGLSGVPELAELRLDGLVEVTGAAFEALAARGALPKLVSLSLAGCSSVRDWGLWNATRLPSLRALDICGSGVTREGVTVLPADIEELGVGGSSVDDCFLRQLSRLAALKRLRIESPSERATDAGVRWAALGSARSGALLALEVNWCAGLTGAFLESLTSLTTLDAHFCRGLSDEGLASGVASLARLRTLRVSGCSSIADAQS